MVPTVIARHECKMRVSPAILPDLIDDLLKFCQVDPNAVTNDEGLYTIDSLYFDNDRWQLFWLSEEGASVRSKIRVRRYLSPKGPASTVKLEVKRKVNAIVTKTSATVPANNWVQLARFPPAGMQFENDGERDAFNIFAIESTRFHVVPKVLVRYRRLALSSLVDEYVRITLDKQIQYQTQTAWSLNPPGPIWRHGDDAAAMQGESKLIMELKFRRSAPQWVVRIIRRYGLEESGFSKYGNVMRRDLIELPDRGRHSAMTLTPGRGFVHARRAAAP